MKFLMAIMLSASLFGSSIGCSQDQLVIAGGANVADKSTTNAANITEGDKLKNNTMKGKKLNIKIGAKTFHATLFDNATGAAFKALLPLTLNMDELNGNEKKYDFSKSLPTNASNPGTINNGDLMIWGSNTLVLFYKTFPTQYSYTKLGRIDDPAGLETAVGPEDVTVTFELE